MQSILTLLLALGFLGLFSLASQIVQKEDEEVGERFESNNMSQYTTIPSINHSETNQPNLSTSVKPDITTNTTLMPVHIYITRSLPINSLQDKKVTPGLNITSNETDDSTSSNEQTIHPRINNLTVVDGEDDLETPIYNNQSASNDSIPSISLIYLLQNNPNSNNNMEQLQNTSCELTSNNTEDNLESNQNENDNEIEFDDIDFLIFNDTDSESNKSSEITKRSAPVFMKDSFVETVLLYQNNILLFNETTTEESNSDPSEAQLYLSLDTDDKVDDVDVNDTGYDYVELRETEIDSFYIDDTLLNQQSSQDLLENIYFENDIFDARELSINTTGSTDQIIEADSDFESSVVKRNIEYNSTTESLPANIQFPTDKQVGSSRPSDDKTKISTINISDNNPLQLNQHITTTEDTEVSQVTVEYDSSEIDVFGYLVNYFGMNPMQNY